MTFPERMRYGGGSQDVTVPLLLAHYPPRDYLFLGFLALQPGNPVWTIALDE